MAHSSKSGRATAHAASGPDSALARFWHSLRKELFDPYRPERHYMRGPGPKWHAKHDYALGNISR